MPACPAYPLLRSIYVLDHHRDVPPGRRAGLSLNPKAHIEQFITRWYTAREADSAQRSEGIEALKRALSQNDRVKRLASNPSLLTLIALIFRVTADLPSGRVKLYDKITEAYLETIEKHREFLERYSYLFHLGG